MTSLTKPKDQKSPTASDRKPVETTSPADGNSESLTTDQRARWNELDEIVKRGAQAFYKVGRALAEIRDEQLYRRDYSSWEDYCRARLDFSKRQADRLICASGVVDELGPIGLNQIVPRTESQAREIVRLHTEEERRDAWQEIVEQHGDAITAEIVKEAVNARLEKPSDDESKPDATDNAAPATIDEPADSGADAVDAIDASSAQEEDADADRPDSGDEAPSATGSHTEQETEESETFSLADSTEHVVSDWIDGVFGRQSVEKALAAVAKHYARSPDAAVICQKLLLGFAATANVALAEFDDEASRRYIQLVCQTLSKLVA